MNTIIHKCPAETKFYKPGDMVAVEYYKGEPWAIGIVKAPTSREYGRTKVVVPGNGTESFMVPGYAPDQIRMATESELEASPPWTKKFVTEDRLNRADPCIDFQQIPGAATQTLRTYGIKRFSQLKKLSDADLLKMKGVGAKALQSLRQWQQETEDQLIVLPEDPEDWF
jgi:hypothetical protein